MTNLDSHRENIPIAVVGFNHRTANVKVREQGAFNESQQSRIMKLLSRDFNTRGSLILSTCNRTEIYVCGRKALKYISEISGTENEPTNLLSISKIIFLPFWVCFTPSLA